MNEENSSRGSHRSNNSGGRRGSGGRRATSSSGSRKRQPKVIDLSEDPNSQEFNDHIVRRPPPSDTQESQAAFHRR